MLFNSQLFIFVFLPVAAAGYFGLNRFRLIGASTWWLAFASLAFYTYWNPSFLPLFLVSIVFNFFAGRYLSRERTRRGRPTAAMRAAVPLILAANLAPLLWYKYSNFVFVNANALFGARLPLSALVLPLGISFYTFVQIAYIVDSFRGEAPEYDFANYCVFITFFPHLIAGPIIHHKQMMPQFFERKNKSLDHENLAAGMLLFSIGLVKKTIVADLFAAWANMGYGTVVRLSFFEAWLTALAYTLQLYFDFSAYSDMALGAALMFNIRLPVNFDSPYQAVNIQDFWKRWHITFSRWLRDYIYIPLGGNRLGEARTYVNLFLTFLIGGIWHGAGWTFVAWGILHGAATTLQKAWQRFGTRLPRLAAWFLTFNFVNVAWVFFRAATFRQALGVLAGMVGLNGVKLPSYLEPRLAALHLRGLEFGAYPSRIPIKTAVPLVALFLGVAFLSPNSNQITSRFRPNWKYAVLIVALLLVGVLGIRQTSTFLYFEF